MQSLISVGMEAYANRTMDKMSDGECQRVMIARACNTAHYFYDEIQKNVDIPIINIIEETVKYAIKTVPGLKTLGVLATEGTIKSGSYERVADRAGRLAFHQGVPRHRHSRTGMRADGRLDAGQLHAVPALLSGRPPQG